MSERDAVERLRVKVEQHYDPVLTRALFPSAADTEGEVSGSEFMSEALAPWISGGRASSPPGKDERLVLAALLVLMRERGNDFKVTFLLPELFGLLGWPLTEPSWEAVEQALDFYMQLVRREYSAPPPPASRTREFSVISLRRLIASHEYYEESERDLPGSVRLAGRRVTVTFNPDVPLGAKVAEFKSGAEGL